MAASQPEGSRGPAGETSRKVKRSRRRDDAGNFVCVSALRRGGRSWKRRHSFISRHRDLALDYLQPRRHEGSAWFSISSLICVWRRGCDLASARTENAINEKTHRPQWKHGIKPLEINELFAFAKIRASGRGQGNQSDGGGGGGVFRSVSINERPTFDVPGFYAANQDIG